MGKPISPFEAGLVLGICPEGARITRARYFAHHAYPCPVEVTVRTRGGDEHSFVLRKVRHRRGSLARESALYPKLAGLGLPVPQVLAGPVRDPGRPGALPVTVLSLLPGTNLQLLSQRGPRQLAQARRLLVEAISSMHALTRRVAASSAGQRVPRGGLLEHLRLIMRKLGPWQKHPLFLDSVRRLTPVLRRIHTPLVFSNGDYQPANFLAEKGRLTGFLDFEYAWFEDPLYGFAKYPIYDIHPLNKAGVVEAFLNRHGFQKADFAPRLALGCLATLSKEIPVRGGDARYRARVLKLLAASL